MNDPKTPQFTFDEMRAIWLALTLHEQSTPERKRDAFIALQKVNDWLRSVGVSAHAAIGGVEWRPDK